MSVEVTARHQQISPGLQQSVREKAETLAADFSRVEHVHVILDKEARDYKAEVVVQAKNHIRVEADETAESMRAAIDMAFEKAERQLRKLRDKVQNHRPKVKELDD